MIRSHWPTKCPSTVLGAIFAVKLFLEGHHPVISMGPVQLPVQWSVACPVARNTCAVPLTTQAGGLASHDARVLWPS